MTSPPSSRPLDATAIAVTVGLCLSFVVIGSRWLVPGDHFDVSQWLGLLLSFLS